MESDQQSISKLTSEMIIINCDENDLQIETYPDDCPVQNNCDNDDDDNDDDNITVQINFEQNSNLDKMIVHDREIKCEIDSIVAKSIVMNEKLVLALVNNKVLAIPQDLRISDRLTTYLWGAEKIYDDTSLSYVEHLNEHLVKVKQTQTPSKYAVFGVKYIKVTKPYDAKVIPTQNGNRLNNPKRQNKFNNHCYVFIDFAAVIVQNNRIIDYAIHKYKSSISKMIDAHQPERVYYNARINDPTDVFVNYPCQPFYTCIKNKGEPQVIYRNNCSLNFLNICKRNDAMCALCNVLRDTYCIINYGFKKQENELWTKPFINWEPYNPYEKYISNKEPPKPTPMLVNEMDLCDMDKNFNSLIGDNPKTQRKLKALNKMHHRARRTSIYKRANKKRW